MWLKGEAMKKGESVKPEVKAGVGRVEEERGRVGAVFDVLQDVQVHVCLPSCLKRRVVESADCEKP